MTLEQKLIEKYFVEGGLVTKCPEEWFTEDIDTLIIENSLSTESCKDWKVCSSITSGAYLGVHNSCSSEQ